MEENVILLEENVINWIKLGDGKKLYSEIEFLRNENGKSFRRLFLTIMEKFGNVEINKKRLKKCPKPLYYI